MERLPVKSSNLASVGYDPESAVLEIEFKSGGIYKYSGVPQSVHYGLMNAASKNKYFHQYVKNDSAFSIPAQPGCHHSIKRVKA